jgi:hypothetical protein
VGEEGGATEVLLRKKLAVVLAATLMLALSSGPAAFAASNPSGTGPPNQECGDPAGAQAYSPKCLEMKFSELPLLDLLGSSAYRRVEDRAMLLLRNTSSHLYLLLATAVDVVLLTSKVIVPPFTAIELVLLPPVPGSGQEIVAIPP